MTASWRVRKDMMTDIDSPPALLSSRMAEDQRDLVFSPGTGLVFQS